MLDLSSVPTLQGATSTTFSRPPFDDSLTIPELFTHHAANSPRHPLFRYPDEGKKLTTICYSEAYRGICKAAEFMSGHFKRVEEKYALQAQQDGLDAPTIGILATSDTITFFSLIVGIMHLGLIPFPISTRNSATAVAHLVKKTGVLQLIVSSDAATQRLGHHANELLAKDGDKVDIVPMPHFSDLYNDEEGKGVKKIRERNVDNVTLILHSSGSTAFPKPIRLTSSNLIQGGTAAYFGEVDICGLNIAAHASPMFHAMGTMNIAMTLCTGAFIGCFKPASPPVVPTPELFLDAIVATGCNIAFAVPSFVEEWSKSSENVSKMRTLNILAYGGGPLSKAVGDRLSAAGVPLISVYGATEFTMNVFLPDVSKHPGWEYSKVSPHTEVEMVPQEDADDLFEPVILAGRYVKPFVINTTINGRPAYASSDLLQKHPTLPGYYRVYGRVDDQIMLSTGEKTNPTPLEAIFVTDPHIKHALMFGRGRFQNGVLVQPTEPFDSSDEGELADFRNKIWPTVEQVNEYAPSHSRVFKEMIIVTNPSKPFQLTAKGTIRRQICIDAYADEIEAVYKAVQDSSDVEVPIPVSWTSDTTLEFIRELVERVMQMKLSDDDDLFQQGCDSLQATWIRNTIIHAIRTSTTASMHDVPHNLVYMHPSIRILGDFVFHLASTGKKANGASQVEMKAKEMHDLVKKYAATISFPKRFGGKTAAAGDAQTFLVTGTTGRLGCHLLSQLLQKPDIVKVYALNRDSRGSDVALRARQQEAFTTWGLDVVLLDSKKLELIASDLPKEYLGLSKEKYNEIRDSVTAVVHNAWRVDFNLSLSSFEPLIAGVRNLINLSAGSPSSTGPRILFVSSMGVLSNPTSIPVAEEPILDPKVAMGAGYGESKWVAEQLFAYAAQQGGLRTTSVHVGQISGDTLNGGWNTKEWVGALVSAAQALGCVPSHDDIVAWLPVDITASAILDMVGSKTVEPVLNLVHPRPVPWDSLFAPAAARLSLPLVPYAEWLARLEAAAAAAKTAGKNSSSREVQQQDTAVTLLEFFRRGNFDGRIRLSTEKAQRCSATLAEFRQLNKEDMLKTLEYWAKAGILKL
ncbi:acetyl-CoA synthetase-like protein [Sparassis crispa]|uniref:Acetyl-CoA synthetase-like protein n=1 Tax=Sparassis crispa TaxID=139825 RepID=A0A401H5M1_9APHY|nr:acetyl-CoA synthetase-like protein [Sparassis crispa]GBE89735.1 acetyl-CoA synthetase-like protein [Sparassis crispa]